MMRSHRPATASQAHYILALFGADFFLQPTGHFAQGKHCCPHARPVRARPRSSGIPIRGTAEECGESMGKRQTDQAKAACETVALAGTVRTISSRRPPTGSRPAPAKGKTIPVGDLAAMERDALLDLWRDCFGGSAPKGMSLSFLRRFLAFELQARAQGGLPAPLRAKLDRIDAGRDRAPTPSLTSGGRLLREWNGITHVVDVTPRGYLWQGKYHRSLSVIARAITGAHWSGPRFFGVKKTAGSGGAAGAAKPKAAPQGRRKAGGL